MRTFFDSHGRGYQLDGLLRTERGSYGALFPQASTFRARCLSPRRQRPPRAADYTAADPRSEALAEMVLVTHIPLLSSFQAARGPWEDARLQLVWRNLRLRRRVHHPLLRALVDAFYTDDVFSVPLIGSPPVLTFRDSSESSTAAASMRPLAPLRDQCVAGEGGDGEIARAADTTTETAVAPAAATTALVVVEEYVEGCSLADYIDAVLAKRLVPGRVTAQRDAMAFGFQLLQLLLALHAVGHLVCRELPLDCVFLDQNRGTLSVRLPLSAVEIVEEGGGGGEAVDDATRAVVPPPMGEGSGTIAGVGCTHLYAPELRELLYWDGMALAQSNGGAALGSPDVWAVGLLLGQLCLLGGGDLPFSSYAEWVGLLRGNLHRLPDALLRAETDEAVAELVGSCLRESPAERPSELVLLSTADAFAKFHSFARLEQNRAVISVAEAVLGSIKPDLPPSAPTRAASASPPSSGPRSGDLVGLPSLKNVTWKIPVAYRDAFSPSKLPPGCGECVAAAITVASKGVVAAEPSLAPSLARATRETLEDVTLLHHHYQQRCTSEMANLPPRTPPVRESVVDESLCERVHRTRQLSQDLPTTTMLLDKLAENFARLEEADPDACLHFVELLLESFSSSASDMATVTGCVTLADAVLHDPPFPNSAAVANVEDAEMPQISAEEDPPASPSTSNAALNVAGTLRVMPSMPVHVISSERAVNTSAVLYNTWLKKQKRKFLKADNYF